MELKKIGVLSFAKITAIFGIVIWLIQIILLAVLKKTIENLPIEQQINLIPTSIELTFAYVIGSLVISIVIYFVAGVLVAFIYNLIAKYLGGIKIEFKEKKK